MVKESCKWVENTVGKGEITLYEQVLLFPQCFLKTCTAGLVWERVKTLSTEMNSGRINV